MAQGGVGHGGRGAGRRGSAATGQRGTSEDAIPGLGGGCCGRAFAVIFTCTLSESSQQPYRWGQCQLHLRAGETEAQSDQMAYRRSLISLGGPPDLLQYRVSTFEGIWGLRGPVE